MIFTAAVLAILSPLRLPAQGFGFAYYDVDRLYDTEPSLFYNDSDYTPDGRLHWNAERYERKTGRIAAVLDSMAMPVVALYGVENEQTVRDIVTRSRLDYSYIHRTMNTFDGLDFALLYYGDLLFPIDIECDRNSLTVKALVDGRETVFVLLRRGRYLADILDDLRQSHPNSTIVAAGTLPDSNAAAAGFRDVMAKAERAGHGNALYSDGWRMDGRIWVSGAETTDGEVFVRRWLLDRKGAPAATYEATEYRGGTSRRLPVWCLIR